MVMAGAIIAPVLPEILTGLHIAPQSGSSLVSLHFLTMGIATPLFGILADRVGHRRLLITMLVSYAAIGMAGGLAQNLITLMGLRVLLGVASGGVAAAGLGLVGQRYVGEARTQVIGYVSTALTLGNVLYPLLGAVVGGWNWRWVFGLYGVGLPIALWVRLTDRQQVMEVATEPAIDPHEPQSAALPPAPPIKLGQLFTQPVTLGLLVSLSLASGMVYSMVAYLPLYLKANFATTVTVNGVMLALQAVGAAVISAIGMQPLSQRFGTRGCIGMGLGVMGIALLLLPWVPHLGLVVPLALLFGMGFGVVVPNLYDALAQVAPANLQASLMAAGTGVSFLGQFLAPIGLSLVVAQWGLGGVFRTAAAIALGLAGGILSRTGKN
ncbi:MAG: hypothetical protein RLZZ511_3517 [Cyanobacteriota bacterium]|jgi:MFS transporter, ACDE family, multidrug resistance protein